MKAVTLVTGAGSGIGAALCRTLAAPGRALVIHTRARRENTERVAAAARQAGAETHILLGDLAESGRAASLVEATHDRFGRLDHLVHVAGYADRKKFGVQDEEGLERSLAAIPKAFFALATTALPLLEPPNTAASSRSARFSRIPSALAAMRFPPRRRRRQG